jgi:hypothetical protein
MKRLKHIPSRSLRAESGQAIVESMLTMIVICLILFGLLQVFQIAAANLITSYSAFTSGRSYAVGFSADENGPWWRCLVYKSARVAAVGASGKRLYPENSSNFNEKDVIVRYLSEDGQWLEYEYWWGGNDYNLNFYSNRVSPPSTHFGYSISTTGTGNTQSTTRFNNYPFPIMDLMDPDRVWFDTVKDSRDISATAEIYNHAEDYMKE